MDIAQEVGVPPPFYMDSEAFAKSGETYLFYARVPVEMVSDQVVGIVLLKTTAPPHGIFIPNEELPCLADLINGLVKRANLGKRV